MEFQNHDSFGDNTHTHTHIYIYIDTHIDIQFTYGHFKDIEEMKNFTRDTKFYKQKKKKKLHATHISVYLKYTTI